MLSRPATTPVFCVGLEAFCFLGFSALGLRISLLDFFWLFAIIVLRQATAHVAPIRLSGLNSER